MLIFEKKIRRQKVKTRGISCLYSTEHNRIFKDSKGYEGIISQTLMPYNKCVTGKHLNDKTLA